MKKTILMLLLFSGAAFAQEDTTKTSNEEDRFEYNVFKEKVYWWQLEKNWKVSPLEIFSGVPTLGVDLETRMTPKLSFQYGAAVVPSAFQFMTNNNLDEGAFNRMNGYKLRFEARGYILRKPNRYFSAELSFRHLIINDDMRIGQEGDGNGNFAFFINENVNAHRFSTQLNLKLGINKVCKSGFVVDFYGGVSLRNNSVAMKKLDTPGEVMPDWNVANWDLTPGHSFNYITPVIGLKLGFNKPAKENL